MRRGHIHRLAALAGCTSFWLLSSCSPDGASGPGTRGAIRVTVGGGQHGMPGVSLPQSIEIEVLDTRGSPVPGVRVMWTAADGGFFEPPVTRTDDNGAARAVWTLGAGEGVHNASAVAPGFRAVEFIAETDIHEPPLGQLVPLQLSTYDGSDQSVHPDFATADAPGVTGDLLAITPYPFGNAAFENPSLYTSTEIVSWSTPAGARNPVVSPRAGYLSDPDLLYDPDARELRLYYREVDSENVILLTRSADGVHWTSPVPVAHAPNHGIISPAVVRLATDRWLMWSINGYEGCTGNTTSVELRRSSDGVNWSAPESVHLVQGGGTPWHIDVQWIPSRSEFWAVYNLKFAGSCTTPALYLATSRDGVTWQTYPTPVLAHGVSAAFEDVIYRSTFTYAPDEDVVTFWYSGATYGDGEYVWKSAVQRRSRGELFATIAHPSRTASLPARPGVPPLLVAP